MESRMQGTRQQYQAYASATQTVAGTRQVVMLFDGMIRFLQQAREAMQHQRIEERYHLLVRVSEILFGLQSCLDFEGGGEVAKILYHFYGSIDSRVFGLHRSNDVDECGRIIDDLRNMREAWGEIDSTAAAQAALPPSPAPVEGGGSALPGGLAVSA